MKSEMTKIAFLSDGIYNRDIGVFGKTQEMTFP